MPGVYSCEPKNLEVNPKTAIFTMRIVNNSTMKKFTLCRKQNLTGSIMIHIAAILLMFLPSHLSAQSNTLYLANKTECDFSVEICLCDDSCFNETLLAMSTLNIPAPPKDLRFNVFGNPTTELAVSFALESEGCDPDDYFTEWGSNPCGQGQHTISIINGSIYSFGIY